MLRRRPFLCSRPPTALEFPATSLISGTAADNVAVQKVETELDNGHLGDGQWNDIVESEFEQFQFSQWPASDFRPGDGHQR